MNEKFIPLSVPNLKGKELEYVTTAVETEWVSTAGPYVEQFEDVVAKYVGTPKAVSCQSGTAGIHVSLMLCGVTRDDMVIVPPLSFIASVNPVKYIGAEPVFIDCDDSLCIDPVKLRQFCENECEIKNNTLFHKETGKRIPVIVVVHIFGNMADMEAIMDIADDFHLTVVEDACEALGTKYTDGRYKGMHAGTIGKIGIFSFNGNKIVTTGGGGMIVSMDEEILAHAKHLTTQAKADVVNFIHDEIGYNYRLTNLQAALGIAQMEQLEKFIEIKEKNYLRYKEELESIDGLSVLSFRHDIRSNYWFYSLYVDSPYKKNQRELIDALTAEKIQSRPIWGLIHEQKPYLGSRTYKIESAKDYWEHVVNIPCSTNLGDEDVTRVIEVIKKLNV